MFFRPPGFSREKGTSCIISNCFHTYRTTPPPIHTHPIHAANWECHPEVADMIQLQQMGLHGPLGEEGKREEEEGTPVGTEEEEQQKNKFALLMKLEDENT